MPRPKLPDDEKPARVSIRLDRALAEQAEAVRRPGETITEQLHEGLRKLIRARRRKRQD